MANPSRKITQLVLQRFLHSPSNHNPLSLQNSFRNYSSSSSSLPSGFSNCRHLTPEISSKLLISQSYQHNSILIRNFASLTRPQLPPPATRKVLGLGSRRHFSSKTPDFSKLNASLVDKPLSAVKSVFSRYRQAIGLQIEAFWKNNYLVMVGALGLGVCLLLWRLMFGIASTFVSLSEGMAKYGFLALSSAIVAFAGLYVRSRFTINPDRVYRIAMRKLNTSAGILEVMGAPLSGTDLRAYVMSGGGLTLKNFKPKFAKKRCFLIFPIRGSERKGLVSVEVKKNKGQYDMKLLSVDVPMKAGPDQRFFLVGDEEEYRIGGGLIAELRDPIVKAMAAQKEFEALDQKEEEEDEKREREEAERKNREEIEKLEKESTQ